MEVVRCDFSIGPHTHIHPMELEWTVRKAELLAVLFAIPERFFFALWHQCEGTQPIVHFRTHKQSDLQMWLDQKCAMAMPKQRNDCLELGIAVRCISHFDGRAHQMRMLHIIYKLCVCLRVRVLYSR